MMKVRIKINANQAALLKSIIPAVLTDQSPLIGLSEQKLFEWLVIEWYERNYSKIVFQNGGFRTSATYPQAYALSVFLGHFDPSPDQSLALVELSALNNEITRQLFNRK